MFFKQIKRHGDNFSYIIADETTREATIVDPSFNSDEISRILKEKKLKAKYIINTHHHGDHTAGNEYLRSEFDSKIVAHKSATGHKDIEVVDGDALKLGEIIIKVIHTPGHTPDSISLLINGKLLTGDTLFVGECGRTDLPGGSSRDMYHSLFQRLMKLDDDVEVYPGHDYGLKTHSTIGAERRTNYTLQRRSLGEFIEFMKEP